GILRRRASGGTSHGCSGGIVTHLDSATRDQNGCDHAAQRSDCNRSHSIPPKLFYPMLPGTHRVGRLVLFFRGGVNRGLCPALETGWVSQACFFSVSLLTCVKRK